MDNINDIYFQKWQERDIEWLLDVYLAEELQWPDPIDVVFSMLAPDEVQS